MKNNCYECKKEYEFPKNLSRKERVKSKFCSRQCYWKNLAKRPATEKQLSNLVGPKFQKGHVGYKAMEGRRHTTESRRKMSEAKKLNPTRYWSGKRRPDMSGAKSIHWKGGLTPIYISIRNSPEYKKWRTSIFHRDKYMCVSCGDNKGGNLEADHIKPFALILQENNIQTLELSRECAELWDLNNGRTLCKNCHRKTDTWGFKGTTRKSQQPKDF